MDGRHKEAYQQMAIFFKQKQHKQTIKFKYHAINTYAEMWRRVVRCTLRPLYLWGNALKCRQARRLGGSHSMHGKCGEETNFSP
jgi:hypothetical protein